MNLVILLGNLTRDPELRHTAGGKAVCNFGLAVNKKVNGADKPMFVDITVWDKSAEAAAEYLSKGRAVAIEGELVLETWEDKTSGQKRSKHTVTAHRWHFAGGAGKSRDEQRQAVSGEEPQSHPEQTGDVPF